MLVAKVRSDISECIKILNLKEKHCNQNVLHPEKIKYIKLLYKFIGIIDSYVEKNVSIKIIHFYRDYLRHKAHRGQ